MKKLSLSIRLISFICLISLVTIATFAGILIKNQIDITTNQNIYQAKVNAITIKRNFSNLIENISSTTSINAGLQSIVDTLAKSRLIERLEVVNANGIIVAASNSRLISAALKAKNLSGIQAISKMSQSNKEKWLYSQIDNTKKEIVLFIPLFSSEKSYVVRAYYSIGTVKDSIKKTYQQIIQMIIVIALINALLGFVIYKTVVNPIMQLNTATKSVTDGNLDEQVDIHTGDEIEELSKTFNEMISALRQMKQRAENANPLTKLPGNIVIQEDCENRIKDNKKFTVIYSDLDNFKAFNDKYGIHAGDEAIMLTSEIMKESIAKCGDSSDFLGHEGGDDFIILTEPERANALADYICSQFDKRIKDLHAKEDLDQGFLISKDRQGNICKFPIMTISLGGVTNEHRHIKTYGEVTNIAAGVKKKAKATPGSCFVLDKRKEGEY